MAVLCEHLIRGIIFGIIALVFGGILFCADAHAVLAITQPTPTGLTNGIPQKWLVGALAQGKAGLDIWGLDAYATLRANPGNIYRVEGFSGTTAKGTWSDVVVESSGKTALIASVDSDYSWTYHTGAAMLYVYAPSPTTVSFHIEHSGVKTAGWLDGESITFSNDAAVPSGFPTLPSGSETPKVAMLALGTGWHSLSLKLLGKLTVGAQFFFAAKFTDSAVALTTSTSDPTADLDKNNILNILIPTISLNAPANLPRQGDPLTVTADVDWHTTDIEPTLATPVTPTNAKLKMTMLDYSGTVVATKEVNSTFPGTVSLDFGNALAPGYYTLRMALYTADGASLIATYPAEGFTVVPDNTVQKSRLSSKKMWDNYYYAFTDTHSTDSWDHIKEWIDRMGIFNITGSDQNATDADLLKWQEASSRGFNVYADFGGDSNSANDNQAATQNYVDKVKSYTKYYKSINELDIKPSSFDTVRDPAHWVARTQWEYETTHTSDPGAFYVGASLVQVGTGSSLTWFQDVLNRGLDQYVDAWDVHAYPQNAPNLSSRYGNSSQEDAPGVEYAYSTLGRTNAKPFVMGETGAYVQHGFTGPRWQAEALAKMVAWINAHSNYLQVSFCVAHESNVDRGRMWGYSYGRKPGEAALATASALIDGLPYTVQSSGDSDIDLAKFGGTYMAWKRSDGAKNWTIQLPNAGPWEIVNVVGSRRALTIDGSNRATISMTPSPIYVVASTGAPTISLTAPVSGTSINQGNSVTVSASATDNGSVANVQFRVDGVDLGVVDTQSPYQVTWNTTTASVGTHILSAIVTDNAGNTTLSTNVTVTVTSSDTTAPLLSDVTPVASVSRDATPNYTFFSNEAGSIAYTGDCSSAATTATSGNNTVTFATLARGVHSNCSLRVTDEANNPSTTLSIASFIISYASDLNQDRTVNILDFGVLHTYYGTTNSAGDVNYDGIVNVLDFGVFHTDYGKSV